VVSRGLPRPWARRGQAKVGQEVLCLPQVVATFLAVSGQRESGLAGDLRLLPPSFSEIAHF
jgi:hypothetical protein